MRIPKRIINKWKILYDRGDIAAICERHNLDKRTVSKGLKGECDTIVFNAIVEFYSAKEQLLKTA